MDQKLSTNNRLKYQFVFRFESLAPQDYCCHSRSDGSKISQFLHIEPIYM